MKTLISLSFIVILFLSFTSAMSATGSNKQQREKDFKICIEELEIQYINEEKLDGVSHEEYQEMILECEEENLM